MRAAQYFGNRDVRVVDVPEPIANENEAIVSIAWGGICGSDLHEYEEGKTNLTRAVFSIASAPLGLEESSYQLYLHSDYQFEIYIVKSFATSTNNFVDVDLRLWMILPV